MHDHVTTFDRVFVGTQPVRRSLLWHLADRANHLLQKCVLFAFYHVPVSLARLNPSLRKSDIRQAHVGATVFENGRYAIYVLWQPSGVVPWYVRNLLEELKEQNVNTITVINHEPSPEQLKVLRGLSAQTLIRANKGLDFGAYRDAVLALTSKTKNVSRLLLFNDSVYVFHRGLKELISELLSDDYPVAAPYECWKWSYHFQSFCIALSGSIVYDPRVQRFWQCYQPIDIRKWRIDHGEIKFSAILQKVASRFKVVYGVNKLLDALVGQGDWVTILKYREFIPRPLRHFFPQDEVLRVLQEATPNERELLLRRLKESLSDLLMLRTQAHTGAFLFPKFLQSPFLKRDIVYRDLYTLYEVERLLSDLGFSQYSQSITDEIRHRGTAAHLKGLTRRKYLLGLTS